MNKEEFENLETLKLLTCAAICYISVKEQIESKMAFSEDLAELYFKMKNVQGTTNLFALSSLAESNLDCNKIKNIGEVLEKMPNYKTYLERYFDEKFGEKSSNIHEELGILGH